jgi:phosphate transport system substrate-binding protein
MRRSLVRSALPLVAAAAIAAACGSSGSSSKATTAPNGTTAPGAKVSGTLNGSGSTFQAVYDAAAIDAFTKTNSGATINYNGTVGSGQGQTDLEGQVTDFAGSDVPISAADQSKLKGGAILYFPTVLGPITVAYKLAGVSKLQLSGTTLAQIFSLKIKKWNDPAIAADNPGATLPSTSITVAHRSDGSGTTSNFTNYLGKADAADWTYGSAKGWPPSITSGTQAGKGNPGVAQIIGSTEGAVGYVDFSDASASNLTFASVKNSSGNFIAPSLDGASAAAAGAKVQSNLLYDPINASGAQAYPIVSPTYIIVYAKQTDATKAALLKAFLTYVLGSNGQNLASTVKFAPLPASLDTQAVAQISQITGP